MIGYRGMNSLISGCNNTCLDIITKQLNGMIWPYFFTISVKAYGRPV